MNHCTDESQLNSAKEFNKHSVADILTQLKAKVPAKKNSAKKRAESPNNLTLTQPSLAKVGIQPSYEKTQVQVKALATIAGNTDLKAGLTFRPEMENVYKKRIPNYLQNSSSELLSRSAIHWIHRLDVTFPILLIHGLEDKKVAAFHSINMAEKLAELEISHELILYPEDGHNLKINRKLALNEVVDWFKQHL